MGDTDPRDPRDEEIARLRTENEQLKARVSELERMVERLTQKVDEALRASKRQAAPFSKGDPKANPKTRGRKPGGDYGLKFHREPPDKIDEVLEAPLPPRCECGDLIEEREVVQQYQEEIPQEPIRRRIDIHVGACRGCGKRHQGRHPFQTSDAVGAAAAQLGPRAQTTIATLKEEAGVSYGRIETIFQRIWGIDISRGGAAHVVLRVGRRLDAPYRGILTTVRRSRTVYPDETGWKVGGWLQWLWDFVCRTATAYVIRDSRGHDVVEKVLGLDWPGVAVHDGWAPYDFLKKATHQQCLAHIQRRCRLILETATRGAVRFPRAVLEFLSDAFAVRERRDAGEYAVKGLAIAIGQLEGRLEELLDWKLTNAANRTFANHLRHHQHELLTFLSHPWVEATSWPADLAIRGAVANRKIFGGNRDESGARAFERVLSVLATCVKRGVDAFSYIGRVLTAPPDQRDRLACRLLRLPAPS